MSIAAPIFPGTPPRRIEILDCTLRDGSYAVNFQFEEQFVTDLLGRLATTPIRRVEIGHGLGLEAERSGVLPSSISDHRWCELALSALADQRWGMFAQPSFTRHEAVSDMVSRGMDFLRVGIEPAQVADNLDYLRTAVDSCDEVYLNLMKSTDTSSESLPRLLDGIPEGLAGVYVVDSAGAMLPADVQRYVSVVADIVETVGFHGHDNLGLANINSITALDSGATLADGTLDGIGRGAGNAQLESLAAIVKLLDSDHFDYRALGQHAHYTRASLNLLPEDRRMQLLGGVIGVHSGHFPLIQELCAEYAVDPALLMELAVELTENSPRTDHFRDAARQLVNCDFSVETRSEHATEGENQ